MAKNVCFQFPLAICVIICASSQCFFTFGSKLDLRVPSKTIQLIRVYKQTFDDGSVTLIWQPSLQPAAQRLKHPFFLKTQQQPITNVGLSAANNEGINTNLYTQKHMTSEPKTIRRIKAKTLEINSLKYIALIADQYFTNSDSLSYTDKVKVKLGGGVRLGFDADSNLIACSTNLNVLGKTSISEGELFTIKKYVVGLPKADNLLNSLVSLNQQMCDQLTGSNSPDSNVHKQPPINIAIKSLISQHRKLDNQPNKQNLHVQQQQASASNNNVVSNALPRLVANDSSGKRVRRNTDFNMLRNFAIFPSTKWCGMGNIATNNSRYGPEIEADMCCEEHDHCNNTIKAGTTLLNYYNPLPITISSCHCDDKFQTCLELARTQTANRVGAWFFNTLAVRCFILEVQKVCQHRILWYCTNYKEEMSVVIYYPQKFVPLSLE